MKVIDASVAVKWFAQEPGREAAMDLIRSGEALIAPDLVIVEVMNVLRRKQRMSILGERQVIDAAAAIGDCFGQLVPAITVAQEAVRLSIALDHSVYDCAYLACSTILGAPLITEDRVFAAKIHARFANARVLNLDHS